MNRTAEITPSAALRAKLRLAAPALAAATGELWAPAGLAARYLRYLQVMHGVLRASVPLMEAACRRCAQRPADPLAAPLGDYLAGHIAEERDHDGWLLEDLTAAGQETVFSLADQPDPLVARLVGAQYYWIQHHHPVCLLGYIAVLEGSAPPPWLAGHLAALTGLPRGAFRTLHHHAIADVGHQADFDTFLDQLPLTAGHERAVAVSALSTVDGLTELLRRLTRPFGGPA
jgi:hypothetical protein